MEKAALQQTFRCRWNRLSKQLALLCLLFWGHLRTELTQVLEVVMKIFESNLKHLKKTIRIS